MKHIKRNLAVAFCIFVAACVPIADDRPQACVSDDECLGNNICVIGVCIDPQSELLDSIDIEVRPPSESGLLPQHVSAIDITDTRDTIELARTVTARGAVVNRSGARVLSQIVATPIVGIANRALIRSARSESSQGEFSLELVAGVPYRVAVFPDDDVAHPPLYLDGSIQVDAGAPLAELGNLEIDSDESALIVSGRVVAGDGVARLGVSGLQVSLQNLERRLSTQIITDADGTFRLILPAGVYENISLQVRATDDNRLTPDLMVNGIDLQETQDLGDIELGVLPSPLPFAGQVTGPGGQAVPLAEIYARAAVGNGEVRARFTADENGNYSGELRPGNYLISVLGPAGNSANGGLLAELQVTIDLEEGAPELTLPERPLVSGRAVDVNQESVGNARVEWVRIGRPFASGAGELGNIGWRFETLTNASGEYEIRVDEGRYRVTVFPEAVSAVPRFSLIHDVSNIDENSSNFNIEMPAAAHFAASLSSGGTPIPDVGVAAYSRFLDASGSAILLSEGTSNALGEVGLILPDLAPPATTDTQRQNISR